MRIVFALIFVFLTFSNTRILGCSVVYFINMATGEIFIANNEDYWYDVNPYIQIIPMTKKGYARLWYGWDDFAQGAFLRTLIVQDHRWETAYREIATNDVWRTVCFRLHD